MPDYKEPADFLSRLVSSVMQNSCLCPMGAPIPGNLLIEDKVIPAHAVFSFDNEGWLCADFTSESPDFNGLGHSATVVQFNASVASFPFCVVIGGGHQISAQGLDFSHLRTVVGESAGDWPGYGDTFTYARVFIRGLPQWWQPAYKKVEYYLPADVEENVVCPFLTFPNASEEYQHFPSSSIMSALHLDLPACGWQVRLREVDAFRNKNKSVSYEGGISRVDRSSFSLTEYRAFVRALEMFLSFVSGDFRFFSGVILSQEDDADMRILSSCRLRFRQSPDSYIGHRFLNPHGHDVWKTLFALADVFVHTYMKRDDFKTLVDSFVASQKAYNDGLGHYASDLAYASLESMARMDGGKGSDAVVQYLQSMEDEMSLLPMPWKLDRSDEAITWRQLENLRNSVAHGGSLRDKVKDDALVAKLEQGGWLKLQRTVMSLVICYLRRQERD